MSRTVDERVVSMEFDNQRFESNVQTSLSTLERLKQSLNLTGAARGFEEVEEASQNVSFDRLTESIESLEDRFSVLGIAGKRAIENITDSVMNLASRTISFLTNSIVQGGINRAMNIENAHFMLQGLLKDEDRVQTIMSQASASVDGTAYSYDAAAKAASQFAASGIQEGEQMETALRAITGVAAMTNSEYEGISQIFTNVAGNGRLMGDQLLSLSSRGMNAAATLTDFFNGVYNGTKKASAGVTAAVKQIMNGSQSVTDDLDTQYNTQKKLYEDDYNEKKKSFDKAYDALSDSLDEEIEAVEKANDKQLKESRKAYEADVAAFEKATDEKIAAIDEQYKESLKLIDEDKYRQLKALDDEIARINAEAEEEEKAREKEEREQKKAELEKAVENAKSVDARKKAEAALAEFNEKNAQKDRAEKRKADIEDLKNQKETVKEEAALQKDALKDRRDEQVKAVKDESKQTLAAMKEQYEEEIDALKESQKEQLKAMRASKKEQLSLLKESQSEQLSYYKEVLNQKTKALKESLKNQQTSLKSGLNAMEVTEADIRDLVSKGLISFDIFSEAMDDAFGEHAKSANETFTGAMSNVKAALGRIGAEFVSPLIEQNGELVQLLNQVRLRINDVKANIGPLANFFVSSVKSAAKAATDFLSKLDINGFAKNLQEFTAKFKMSDKTSQDLKNTFKGLAAILDLVRMAVSAVLSVVSPLVASLGGGLLRAVLHITGTIGEWLMTLDNVVKKHDIFNRSAQVVSTVINSITTALKTLIRYLVKKIYFPDVGTENLNGANAALKVMSDSTAKVGETVQKTFSSIKNAFGKAGEALKNSPFMQMLNTLWTAIKKVAHAISNVFGNAINNIREKLSKLDANELSMILSSLSSVGLGLALGKFVKTLGGPLESLSGILGSISGAIDSIRGISSSISSVMKQVEKSLKAYQTSLKANTLLRIAAAIGIIALSLVILSSIDEEGLKSAISAMTIMLAELVGAMAIFSKISKGLKGGISASAMMIGLSISLLILASAMKKFSSMSLEEIGKGFLGISASLIAIIIAMKNMPTKKNMISTGIGLIAVGAALILISKAMKNVGSMSLEGIGKGLLALTVSLFAISMAMKNMPKNMARSGIGLIAVAAALVIISKALKNMGSMSLEDVGKGLLALTVSLFSISMAMKNMPKNMIRNGIGLIAVAAALVIISKALRNMGSMDIQDLGKGLLALTVSLFAITTAVKSMPKNMIAIGIGLIGVATALIIISQALKSMGSMSLETIGKGLLALTVSLFSISLALRIMPKNMITIGIGLIGVSTALIILAHALQSMGSMEWEEIAKGLVALGGSMLILAVGLNFMKGTLAGSAALLITTIALNLLVPVLKSLGKMSWEDIAKGLVAIAGAFTVLGIAAAVLAPLTPQILALSLSIFALGAGVVGIGAGLLLAGLGLQELAVGFTAFGGSLTVGVTEIIAALGIIVSSMDSIILPLVDKLHVILQSLLTALFELIRDNMPEIRETLKVVLENIFGIIVDVLGTAVEYIPQIITLVFDLIVKVLEGIIPKIPEIIDLVCDFIIKIIDGITARIPELVQSVVNFFMTLFSSVFDALQNVDPAIFEKALYGIGAMSAIIFALSTVAGMIPSAMIGVVGMGGVIAELALVLAAIGALAQIPGLTWIVGEGGNLLESVGNAIGKFIGGFVGGAMEGISDSFPKIGTNLSQFMENVQPFIDGAAKIDSKSMDGVRSLAEVILVLTAANILDGLTSWFTGGTSLVDFGKGLAEFGPEFRKYYDSIGDIDGSTVEASANAAKALAEMANNLPKHGGVVGWFTGENSLSAFARELVAFGPSLVLYSASVTGLNADVVENSISAAKTISEFASNLPKHGGVVGWFTGENKLSDFAKELAVFGPSLMLYAESVTGLDTEVVTNSVHAAEAISGMAANLPKHDGIVDWFTGSNKLSDFAHELTIFGPSLLYYSRSVDGLNADVVINSVNAAKAISGLAANLPDSGGVISWFTGNNDLADFGGQLPDFGRNIKAYADNVEGLNPDVVANSANAAKSLSELANNLGNQGGLFSFFTGDKNLAVFGERLVPFGKSFSEYAKNMENVKPAVVTSTTSAAQSLIELQKRFAESEQGGWFSDNKTLVDFSNDISEFGKGFKNYYDKVKDVKTDHLSKVIAQTNDLITMAISLNSINTNGLEKFSQGLKKFGDAGVKNFIKSFDDAQGKMKEAAQRMTDTFLDEAAKTKQTFTVTFSSLANDGIIGLESKEEDFKMTGKKLMERLIDGMVSKSNDTIAEGSRIIGDAAVKLNTQGVKFTNAARTMLNCFVNGLEDRKSAVEEKAVTVIIFAVTGVKNRYNEFYDAGVYLVEGFILGMKSKVVDVSKAATDMANAAANASAKTLDEHSPSKVGYQIGGYFGQGFVNAIADYESISYRAGENVASSARKGLGNAIAKIADTIDSDMDMQPTITPVIDLSEAKKGIRFLNAQTSFELAGRTQIGFGYSNASLQNEIKLNNDSIITEMNRLRQDIAQLTNTVGKMRVVMDTGALVGAITAPMDSALGRQIVYQKRGN